MGEPGGDRQRLAAALRELRHRARLSTYDLASRLGWSQSKVSRIERGRTLADPEDVSAWAQVTQTPPAEAASLLALAEGMAGQMRPWREVHGGGLAQVQREVAARAAAMTRMRSFAPSTIPGLLQIPAYASRVIELADVSGRGGVAEAVAERMNRQAVLYDPRKSFDFVITEGALRYQAGPPEVMHAQAEKVISVMTLPNVSVSVIPFAAPPTALFASGFVIYDIPGEPMILVETLTRELQLRSTWDLRLYEGTFARLQGSAVTGEAAETLIRAAMIESLH